MRVLVACEFSGIVRDAFRRAGHDATSCDLLPTELPDRKYPHTTHVQGDVRHLLDSSFGWDLMIAFPPCTYLCRSGIHWNKTRPERAAKTEEALEFVRLLLNAPIPRIAIENPVGVISTRIRKPDQVIHPHQFGHPEQGYMPVAQGPAVAQANGPRLSARGSRSPRCARAGPLAGAEPYTPGDRAGDGCAVGRPDTHGGRMSSDYPYPWSEYPGAPGEFTRDPSPAPPVGQEAPPRGAAETPAREDEADPEKVAWRVDEEGRLIPSPFMLRWFTETMARWRAEAMASAPAPTGFHGRVVGGRLRDDGTTTIDVNIPGHHAVEMSIPAAIVLTPPPPAGNPEPAVPVSPASPPGEAPAAAPEPPMNISGLIDSVISEAADYGRAAVSGHATLAQPGRLRQELRDAIRAEIQREKAAREGAERLRSEEAKAFYRERARAEAAEAELQREKEAREKAERAKYGTPCACEAWIEACRQAEDRAAVAEQRLREAEAERDLIRDTLLSRHGGEPAALLAELDEARERLREVEAQVDELADERDAISAALPLGEETGPLPLAVRRVAERLREVEGERDESRRNAEALTEIGLDRHTERDAALSDLAALRERVGELAEELNRYSLSTIGLMNVPARLRALSTSTAEPASDAGAGNPGGEEGKGT